MKTRNLDQWARIYIFVLVLASVIAILSLIVKHTEEKMHFSICSVCVFSFIAGMILGYSSCLKKITKTIISSFKESIRFSTKASTVVSGKLTVVTDGLFIRSIFIEDDTFEVKENKGKNAEEEISAIPGECTLLVGHPLPPKEE